MVISRGTNTRLANDLTRKLQMFGLHAIDYYVDDMISYLDKLDQEDLLIAMSLSGETPALVKTIKKANTKGIKVLTICSEANSSLAKLSDYFIHTVQTPLLLTELSGDYASHLPMELGMRILLDALLLYQANGSLTKACP